MNTRPSTDTKVKKAQEDGTCGGEERLKDIPSVEATEVMKEEAKDAAERKAEGLKDSRDLQDIE